jgi:F1-F0 ATPase (N-ATPase) AtpR subunit
VTPASFALELATAAAFAAGGLAGGRIYFVALARSISLLTDRGREGPAPGSAAFVLTLARIAAAVGFFGLAARFGALPLLAAFLGFLAARVLALRAARRAA